MVKTDLIPSDEHMNAILMRRQGRRNGDLFDGDLWPVVYRVVD
ncbi:MAG: hypothetical protein V2A74_08920 [bacterium]